MVTPVRNESASGVSTITPHNTNDLPTTTRRIRANTAGVIALISVDGSTCVCNFLAGESRDIRATRVLATGTTCTGIEGEY